MAAATTPATAEAGGAGIIVRASVIAVIASFALVTTLMLAGGQRLGPALGLALFASIWGGLGFGAMLGGVAYATRQEDRPDDGPSPS